MLEALENPQGQNNLSYLAIAILAIFLSGIFFGITYFMMNNVQTKMMEVNCELPNNAFYDDCQEWFDQTVYKILNLKSFLIVFSYIFIFALVLGLLVMGYRSGTSPIMTGVLFVITIVFTYAGILISNVYRQLLTNPIMYEMMQPFTIYNKIMLNFPWFVGFIGLLSVFLSIANFQKARTNTPVSDLDY